MVWMEGKGVCFCLNTLSLFFLVGGGIHAIRMSFILRLGVGTLSSPVETFLRRYNGIQSA